MKYVPFGQKGTHVHIFSLPDFMASEVAVGCHLNNGKAGAFNSGEPATRIAGVHAKIKPSRATDRGSPSCLSESYSSNFVTCRWFQLVMGGIQDCSALNFSGGGVMRTSTPVEGDAEHREGSGGGAFGVGDQRGDEKSLAGTGRGDKVGSGAAVIGLGRREPTTEAAGVV